MIRMHNESMPNVLIRDLDPVVHARLTARAEQEGRSLQQYLSAELAKLASRSTFEEVFTDIDASGETVELSPDEIVRAVRRGRVR
jgi:plasmid stability protein